MDGLVEFLLLAPGVVPARPGKLLAITEQEPEFGQLLSYARALREQIDWDEVRARSESSPFARAFFALVEGLGIVEPG